MPRLPLPIVLVLAAFVAGLYSVSLLPNPDSMTGATASTIKISSEHEDSQDHDSQDHDSDDAIRFNAQIRPILSQHCIACHGPDDEERQADRRRLRIDCR